MDLRKLVFLLLLISFSFSGDSLSSLVEQTEQTSTFELVSSWRAITVALLILTVLLIAIARTLGHSFELPELKAWANVELVQAVGTALIILILVGTLSFLDITFAWIVNDSGAPVNCVSTDTAGCAYDIAVEYNQQMIELAEDDIKEILKKSYDAGKWSNFRIGFSLHQMWLGQLSMSHVPDSQRILHIERYTQIMDEYFGILTSLYAQEFFLKEISFKLGPFLLLAGIVLRSFFLTRRLGGLLIAIAIGITVVFPLMYVFDWVTLTVTLYGDALFESPDTLVCPSICTQELPVAYKQNNLNAVYTKSQLANSGWSYLLGGGGQMFEFSDPGDLDTFILNLHPGLYQDPADGVYWNPCNNTGSNDYVWYQECPDECRYVPYPYEKEECNDPEVAKVCNQINPSCKIELTFNQNELPDYLQEQLYLCPDSCKSVPPLANNCKPVEYKRIYDGGGCSACLCKPGSPSSTYKSMCNNYIADKYDITYAEADELREAAISAQGGGYEVAGCNIWSLCYFIPPATIDSCAEAKPDCKVTYFEIDEDTGEKVIKATKPFDTLGKTYYSSFETPSACGDDEEKEKAYTCPVSLDPQKNCVYIIPEDTEKCSGCLFVDTGFTFEPPVALNCDAMCGADTSTFSTVSTGQFAKSSANGLYGTQHTRNVSSLFVPAYILPLLNILVTIMFIKTFSPMLGGDIDIPGLAKVL